MRVLVTGSSGFLGFHLTRFLERQGVDVFGTYATQRPGFATAEVFQLDVRSSDDWRRVLTSLSPTHVVHTAALSQTGDCEKYPDLAHAVNVHGVQNMIEAAAELDDLPHLVHLSTDLVFDGTAAPYSESGQPNPIQVYGRTKLQAEHALSRYAGKWTIVRSALIYGTETPHHQSFLQWMLHGLRSGTGKLFADEYRSPIWVDDLSRAIQGICTTGADGLFHCGGGQRLSRWEFGQLVGRIYDTPVADTMRGTRTEAGLESTRPADVSLDSAKLQAAIKWQPTPTEEALRACLSPTAPA